MADDGNLVGAIYRVASGAIVAAWRALGVELDVQGHEHLPRTGPAIVASNHVSYVDFAFVMLAPPRPRREMRFLARADLFDRAPVGWFMRSVGQIPVDTHGEPLRAMRAAVAALERGELVGIHPEGTISPSFVPRRAAGGAVRMAEATGAPIVPCAVWGTQRILTKWRPRGRVPRGVRVVVRYGPAYHPTERTPLARTQDLMSRISTLLDEAMATDDLEPGAWWVPAHLGGGAPTPEEAEARLTAQREERKARARERAGTAAVAEVPEADPGA